MGAHADTAALSLPVNTRVADCIAIAITQQAVLCGREPWPETPDAEGALRAQLCDMAEQWRPRW